MADEVLKIKPEDKLNPTTRYYETIGTLYEDFYKAKSARDSSQKQFQGKTFEEYLRISRELFWTSMVTESEDLRSLDLDFSLPFVRKEVMDYVGRITSMNIDPKMMGDGLGVYGVNVLQAMYQKWRLHSNDKTEKFWDVLYGVVNGTTCKYVGFDGGERTKSFLTSYDPKTGSYATEQKQMKMWNDAFSEICPLEEIYLQKIWERNIQKQGKVFRMHEYTKAEFDREFPKDKYPEAEFVVTGNLIDEDSLFYRLLNASGVTNVDRVQVMRCTDTDSDRLMEVANGVWLNAIGTKRDEHRPMPFKHKMQPYVWAISEAIDEKFAYGLSTPFKLKDPHKILNTSYTMLVERELRAIDPPVLTSDFEAPELIFGQKKVIPVNDVEAYKEMNIAEASGSFMTMQNSLQGLMTSFGQGGFAQVAPSRQPKAAREIIQIEQMKQQALGNALIMYYNLIYQEIFLLLKTMLQFYETGKYAAQEDNLVRSFTVPDFPLSTGGTGNMEVRFVKKPQDGLALYFEAVDKSIQNGKGTQILEVPIEILEHLEFYIDDIELESNKSSELEKAAWTENVLNPIMQFFLPMGLADPAKVFARMLEKNGEHPADYAPASIMSGLMSGWGLDRFKIPPEVAAAMAGGGAPAQNGNMMQSGRGTMFGGKSNGGFPGGENG